MKLYYDKEGRDINIETKKSHIYFGAFHCWQRWALPLWVEWFRTKGYLELEVSLFCGNFTLTRITHEESKRLDKSFERMINDEKN